MALPPAGYTSTNTNPPIDNALSNLDRITNHIDEKKPSKIKMRGLQSDMLGHIGAIRDELWSLCCGTLGHFFLSMSPQVCRCSSHRDFRRCQELLFEN